eukprot:284816963_1
MWTSSRGTGYSSTAQFSPGGHLNTLGCSGCPRTFVRVNHAATLLAALRKNRPILLSLMDLRNLADKELLSSLSAARPKSPEIGFCEGTSVGKRIQLDKAKLDPAATFRSACAAVARLVTFTPRGMAQTAISVRRYFSYSSSGIDYCSVSLKYTTASTFRQAIRGISFCITSSDLFCNDGKCSEPSRKTSKNPSHRRSTSIPASRFSSDSSDLQRNCCKSKPTSGSPRTLSLSRLQKWQILIYYIKNGLLWFVFNRYVFSISTTEDLEDVERQNAALRKKLELFENATRYKTSPGKSGEILSCCFCWHQVTFPGGLLCRYLAIGSLPGPSIRCCYCWLLLERKASLWGSSSSRQNHSTRFGNTRMMVDTALSGDILVLSTTWISIKQENGIGLLEGVRISYQAGVVLSRYHQDLGLRGIRVLENSQWPRSSCLRSFLTERRLPLFLFKGDSKTLGPRYSSQCLMRNRRSTGVRKQFVKPCHVERQDEQPRRKRCGKLQPDLTWLCQAVFSF